MLTYTFDTLAYIYVLDTSSYIYWHICPLTYKTSLYNPIWTGDVRAQPVFLAGPRPAIQVTESQEGEVGGGEVPIFVESP